MLMETIREQFETLDAFEGKIPILEFDIIMENVRKLYEDLYLLQHLNDPYDYIKKFPAFTPPVQKVEKQEDPAEQKEEDVKSDLLTSKTSSFNDKLMEAREQSLGPRFSQTNQGDIKSLININDKFLFINELFDGDYKDYTQAIDTFNTFTEKRDAFDFLDSLLKNNLWNSTSAAFIKLKEIVEKKF